MPSSLGLFEDFLIPCLGHPQHLHSVTDPEHSHFLVKDVHAEKHVFRPLLFPLSNLGAGPVKYVVNEQLEQDNIELTAPITEIASTGYKSRLYP